MTKSLYCLFGQVVDTRKKKGLRHPLASFLMMSTLGMMSGYTAMQELAVFFKSNESTFNEMFEFDHGVPGYTQIRTILMGIDYTSLIGAFKEWICQFVEIEESEWLASDGKVLGSTVTDHQTSQQNYIAVVSLFSQKAGIVLGSQIYKNKKGNEIAVAQNLLKELLEKLQAKNIVIALDALHCQKTTVATIIESGNHYCIAVKGNQPSLQKQVIQTTLCNEPIDTYKKSETNRGRKENREVFLYNNTDLIGEEWIGVQRIIHVHRYGWRKDKKEPHYDEHHYYILSKQIDDATTVADGIRGYWKIENSLHYVKDVVQNEDDNGISSGNAAENLAVLKDFAINIFRLNGFQSLKKANIKFANKIKSMIDIIENINLRKNKTD